MSIFVAFKYIMILGIFGTSFALILFNRLIKQTSAVFASSVTYLIPMVALIWGVLERETIKQEHILGILIILSGVYLVNKKSKIIIP